MKSLILGFVLAVNAFAGANVSHLDYFTGQNKAFFDAGFGYNDVSNDDDDKVLSGTIEARYGVLANSYFGVTANYNSTDTGLEENVNEFQDLTINWATRFVNTEMTKWDWNVNYAPRLGEYKADGISGRHTINTSFDYTQMLSEMVELGATTGFTFVSKNKDISVSNFSHKFDLGLNTRFHFTNGMFAGLGASTFANTSGNSDDSGDWNFTGNGVVGYAFNKRMSLAGTVKWNNVIGDSSDSYGMLYGANLNIEFL